VNTDALGFFGLIGSFSHGGILTQAARICHGSIQ
jgi:hypothetical protein